MVFVYYLFLNEKTHFVICLFVLLTACYIFHVSIFEETDDLSEFNLWSEEEIGCSHFTIQQENIKMKSSTDGPRSIS